METPRRPSVTHHTVKLHETYAMLQGPRQAAHWYLQRHPTSNPNLTITRPAQIICLSTPVFPTIFGQKDEKKRSPKNRGMRKERKNRSFPFSFPFPLFYLSFLVISLTKHYICFRPWSQQGLCPRRLPIPSLSNHRVS